MKSTNMTSMNVVKFKPKKLNPFRDPRFPLRILIPYAPILIDSGLEKIKALDEEREARKAKQNRDRVAKCRKLDSKAKDEAKAYNETNKNRKKKPKQFRKRPIPVLLTEEEVTEAVRDATFPPLGRPPTREEERDVISRVITEAARRGLRK